MNHEVQMPTWEGAILRRKQANQYRDTLRSSVQTDRGAVWVVGSHGPKASCVTWESRSPFEGAILVDRGAYCKL